MKKSIVRWDQFREGDVIVSTHANHAGAVVVEREVARPVFGTATVGGETHHGFLTVGGHFVYPLEEGSASTRSHSYFTPDPDWQAAVDAYARGFRRVRVSVDQFQMEPGVREGLHHVLNQVYDERYAAVEAPQRGRIADAAFAALSRWLPNSKHRVEASQAVADAMLKLREEQP